MSGLEVKVDTGDLDGLVDDLGRLADDLDRELQRTSVDVSRQLAADARSKARSLGGVAGHSAPGVTDAETSDGGEVVLDGSRYPTILGAEFGGQGRPTTQQFDPWRGGVDSGGYFLYPTVQAADKDIDEAYDQAADHALKEAGFR